MKKHWMLYGVAGALVYVTAGCSAPSDDNNRTSVDQPPANSAPADPAQEQPADYLVLAFGDSLYAGYGVRQDESFPAQLQAALQKQGLSVDIRNAGVSGDTTAAGLQRLAFALDGLSRKPDLVVLGLGGNDMLRGLTPVETRANLKAMLDELDKRGIKVLLTGLVAAPNLGADYAKAFNPIFPDLAKQYDADLYPFFLDGVITDKALMLPDGIHPNAKGIALVVGKVAPMVSEELKNQAD